MSMTWCWWKSTDKTKNFLIRDDVKFCFYVRNEEQLKMKFSEKILPRKNHDRDKIKSMTLTYELLSIFPSSLLLPLFLENSWSNIIFKNFHIFTYTILKVSSLSVFLRNFQEKWEGLKKIDGSLCMIWVHCMLHPKSVNQSWAGD